MNIIGKTFSSWTVLAPAPRRGRIYFVVCRCECGGEHIVRSASLTNGTSTKCRSCASSKHGGRKNPLYYIWNNMKQRCANADHEQYHRYGGRGIKVCDRWIAGDGKISGYECFAEDMGPRPSALYSIDRIENNKGYEPGNCRWATDIEQNRNTRSNVWIDGKLLVELAEETGIHKTTLYGRYWRGDRGERLLRPSRSYSQKESR